MQRLFEEGGFYHVYNRGVDKREVFDSVYDLQRFLQSMVEFNTREPIGSLHLNSFDAVKRGCRSEPLVDIISYCLNSNHYHFILKQCVENGISEFMKRLGGGYTKYFNHRNRRSGVLFQGKYKSIHIVTNEYLLYLSAYVNLNDCVHQLRRPTSQSSWGEYINKDKKGICHKEIILDQFKNSEDYKQFAEEALVNILERKNLAKELEDMLFD
ncbi:MAG: transposase [Patescibacteria group bacterium]